MSGNGRPVPADVRPKHQSRLRGAFEAVWRSSVRFVDDGCFDHAAVISHFSLLSLIPLTLLLVSFGTWVFGSQDVAEQGTQHMLQDLFRRLGPQVMDQVKAVHAQVGHEWVFFVLALWTASKVFSKLQAGLDRAFQVQERHAYPIRKLIAFGFVLFLGGVLVTMILVESGLSSVDQFIEGSPWARLREAPLYIWFNGWITRHLIPWCTAMGSLVFVYKFLPARQVPWRPVLIAGIVTGSVWETLKISFTYYATHLATYSRTYGAMEAVVVFLVWINLSASLLLWGAELASELAGFRTAGPVSEEI